MIEVQGLLKGVESHVARMVEEKDAEIVRLQQENNRLQQELQRKVDQFHYFKSLLANVMQSMEGNQATSNIPQPQGEPTFHRGVEVIEESSDEEEEVFTPLEEVIEVQSELSKTALGNKKLRDSYTRLSNSPLTNVEYIEEEEEVSGRVRSPYKYNQLRDRIGKSPHKAPKMNQLQEKYEEYLSPESKKIIRKLSKLH